VDAGDGQKREGEHRHGGDGHEDGEGGAVEDVGEASDHFGISSFLLQCSVMSVERAVPMPMINTGTSFFDQINIE
jgi:hypothetical protein